jgi:hypothetical protein
MQQFWRDANTAARHTALNTIIRYNVYGKALLVPHCLRAPRLSH